MVGNNKGEAQLKPGIRIGQYSLIREIGRGGMGEVFLARDMQLGRKVALKLLHPRALGSLQSVERFMFEAKVTARFSHPNIVTVYGVGVHEERPYVALEYLEGRTLRDRIRESTLSVMETSRIGMAVAEALAEAHAHKVLHRDLKPANILIPRDGRIRVVDFGLAKAFSPEEKEGAERARQENALPRISGIDQPSLTRESQLMGTPTYMSPEQWASEPADGATDMWAFGMVLFEALTGSRPFHEQSIERQCAKVCSHEKPPPIAVAEDIPDELEALIMGCLEKDSKTRPTAKDAVQVLFKIVHKDRTLSKEDESPFRGLLPFTESHAPMFFGRDRETAAFLERMRDTPVIPIVGPSGGGKSSFVQAGVIPRLREQSTWLVLRVRPGRQPFEALVSRLLRGDFDRTSQGAGTWRTGKTSENSEGVATAGSAELKRQAMLADIAGDRFLEERNDGKFLEWLLESPNRLSLLLARLAEQEKAGVLLFVDQLEELYTLVGDGSLRQRFMEMVCTAADDPEGPVRVIFTLRDDFMARVANNPAGREALGSLVVLGKPSENALKEIVVNPVAEMGYRYEDPSIVEEMVESVQNENACLPLIQFTCTQLWERRDQSQKLITREQFDKLGGVEGSLAHQMERVLEGLVHQEVAVAREIFMRLVTPERTRRTTEKESLLEDFGESGNQVLDKLIRERAVLVRRGVEKGSVRVEIVHESLIRTWPRLRRWIDESHDEIAFLGEVEQAAGLWEQRGRRDEEVWTGDALQEALFKARRITNLPSRVDLFLSAGRKLERKKTKTRRVLYSASFMILALVAVILAILYQEAQEQRKLADSQREVAETERSEALKEGAGASFLKEDYMEARAKLRLALEGRDSSFTRNLWWNLNRQPIFWKRHIASVSPSLDLSPDGNRVAVGRQDGSVYVFDLKTQGIRVLRGMGDQIGALDYSPDGKWLACITWGGEVGAWNLKNGSARKLGKTEGGATAIVYSPDGKMLIAPNGTKSVRIWDAATGAIVKDLETVARSVSVDPSGKLLAVGGKEGIVRIFDLETFKLQREMPGNKVQINSIEFSPNGKAVTSCTLRGAQVWNAATGELLHDLDGHDGPVMDVSYSKDGTTIATAGKDSNIIFWNSKTGERKETLAGKGNSIDVLDLCPDGKTLVSLNADGVIAVQERKKESDNLPSRGHTTPSYGLAFSPNGETLVSGGSDGTIRFWDVENGVETRVFKGHEAGIWEVDFSPDGKILASASGDGTIRLWDVDSGAKLKVLEGYDADVTGLRFSPDNKKIAGSSIDRTIRLWNTESGELICILKGHESLVFGIDFSPDGKTLVSASLDKTIRLWDVQTGKEKDVLRGHEAELWSAVFSPDGKQVASCGYDGVVRLWNLQTRQSTVVAKVDGRIYWLAFHPDGERIGASVSDGTARIWNISTGEELILTGHSREVNWFRLSLDGKYAATSSDDATVRVWRVDNGMPVWRAPVLLPNPPELFTQAGWQRFGKENAKFAKTAWREAVEKKALFAAVSKDGTRMCLAANEGGFEMWDLPADKLLAGDKNAKITDIEVVKDRCLILTSEGKSLLAGPDGFQKVLAAGATAIALVDDLIMIATDKKIVEFDSLGERLTETDADIGVTVVSKIDDILLVGYSEGNVEINHPSGDLAQKVHLEGVPSAAAIRIEPGPMNTMFAGFSNGFLGLWNRENGQLLESARLHGPVAHMVLHGEKMYAATTLGDHLEWDLSVYDKKYCELLRELWSEVPVVWEDGRLKEKALPVDHVCAR